MAIHPNFPTSPHAILNPEVRWFPADENLREKSYDKLLPPLVAELRKRVKAWRDSDYRGASPTSRGSNQVIPPPRKLPIDNSGKPSLALLLISRKSAASAISAPAPRA